MLKLEDGVSITVDYRESKAGDLWKVFTAGHLFHILCFSFIPKCIKIKLIFNLRVLHTSLHSAKVKRFVLNSCKIIKKINLPNIQPLTLKTEVSYVQFLLIISQMFQQLYWRPLVVNSVDWT